MEHVLLSKLPVFENLCIFYIFDKLKNNYMGHHSKLPLDEKLYYFIKTQGRPYLEKGWTDFNKTETIYPI